MITRAPLRRLSCGLLLALLAVSAAVLTMRGLVIEHALTAWNGPITPLVAFERLRIIQSFMPRVAISILAGAALGFSGTIFQHILRNPLAEPTTLGTSAGAALALAAASLFAPGLFAFGQAWVALAGAVISTSLVVLLALGSSLSPLTLVISGMVVSFLCGSVSGMLVLLHTQYLSSLFIWSAGSLVQTDWRVVEALAVGTLSVIAVTALLLRPLSVLTLEDEAARSLGIPVSAIRLTTLALAVALAAFVVSAVGVIGFIGLAAPAMARSLGAHRLNQRLLHASLLGGALLWLTDQIVQLIQMILPSATTGMATALLGAPVLLWLLPKGRAAMVPPRPVNGTIGRVPPWLAVKLSAAAMLAILVAMALDFGRTAHGWQFAGEAEFTALLQWRWPRVLASLASGAMLAAAGTLLQRLTGNDLASPEVLGLSSGAGLGVITRAFVMAAPDAATQVLAAAAGALVTLAAMLMVGRRSAFSPDRLLLVGIAIGSLSGVFVAFLLATGDPRLDRLLSWMAGSTYAVTRQDAIVCVITCGLSLAILPLIHRLLVILPLGEATSQQIGIHLGRSRLILLLFTAILTGAPTLIVGPLSFVGLMAPHMARMIGLRRPMPQLYGAALLGALIMLLADWLGRNLMFPNQLPAGLLASLIGGPYFLWLMRQKKT